MEQTSDTRTKLVRYCGFWNAAVMLEPVFGAVVPSTTLLLPSGEDPVRPVCRGGP